VTTKLGVFLIPPPEHSFYRIATDIIGYDIWGRQPVPSLLGDDIDAATLARWAGRAPVFGLHCTIAGGDIVYRDDDIPEIQDRLAWIASRTAPFTVTNGRIDDDFFANPYVVVTTFDSADSALQRLHERVVTTVSPLHVSTECSQPGDRADARAWNLYTRTGETRALERFVPHWSLLTSLPGDPDRVRARELIRRRTGLFSDDTTRTLDVGDVHLVQQSDDGHFAVIGSYQLTGS
jgi:hypothetical protein